MELRDAIDLLGASALDSGRPGTWADLGCGDGTFTRALAEHLTPSSTIHAMDRNRTALARLPAVQHGVRIDAHRGDFTRLPWPFADVDGILMANSLHYVRDQEAFLRRCLTNLTSRGPFLIVEYDRDAANRWVPYPVNRAALERLFRAVGYSQIVTLGSRPSIYHSAGLYAALVRP